jgi:hypothetical protein
VSGTCFTKTIKFTQITPIAGYCIEKTGKGQGLSMTFFKILSISNETDKNPALQDFVDNLL